MIFWRLLAKSGKPEKAVNKTAVCAIFVYCAVILSVLGLLDDAGKTWKLAVQTFALLAVLDIFILCRVI